MEDKNLCPMCFNNPADVSYDCIKKQCSWYIEDKQKCAIAVLAEKRCGK